MEPQIEVKKTHCTRCGECCLAAGPSLQKSDLPLFFNHVLDSTHLYTIRKGELVRDNINDALKFTDQEIIKLKDRETGKGCILYDDGEKACTIYADRPSQCRAFACWDSEEFKAVFAEPKATRKDIIRDPNLLRLISAHEKTCDYQVISHYVKQIQQKGDSIIREVLKILQYDQDIRRLTHEKLGIDPRELDLLYGRPLTETIHMFGLTVKQEADGSFLLTTEDH
ncbi:MAG: YkgJ family cysteine cluster protein [Deltaproteobacteria bacterium]|jgi:Fe-S-cluster containining protein|nr:YkgJ family cysteine cluster protein [Deltaproteobacteria bacterium]